MSHVQKFAEMINKVDSLHGEATSLRKLVQTENQEKLILNIHRFLKGAILKSIPYEHKKLLNNTDAELGVIQFLDILIRIIDAFENPKSLYLGYGYLAYNRADHKHNRYYTDIIVIINDIAFEFSPNPYGKPLFLRNPLNNKPNMKLKVYKSDNYISTMIRPNTLIQIDYKNYL